MDNLDKNTTEEKSDSTKKNEDGKLKLLVKAIHGQEGNPFFITISNLTPRPLKDVSLLDHLNENTETIAYHGINNCSKSYRKFLNYINSYKESEGVSIRHIYIHSDNKLSVVKLKVKYTYPTGLVSERLVPITLDPMQQQSGILYGKLPDFFLRLNVILDLIVDKLDAHQTMTFRFIPGETILVPVENKSNKIEQ